MKYNYSKLVFIIVLSIILLGVIFFYYKLSIKKENFDSTLHKQKNNGKKYVKYINNTSAGLSHLKSNLTCILKEAYFNNKILIIPNFNLSPIHNNNNKIVSNLSKYYDYSRLKINNKKYKVILDSSDIDNNLVEVIKLTNQLSSHDKRIFHSKKKLDIDLPFNKNIINIAQTVSDKLNKYICIHVRRGDMLSFKKNLNNDTSSKNIINILKKYKWKGNIYIMTNEKNLSIFNELKSKYPNKVYFYKDFKNLRNINDNYYLFSIEKVIMNNANVKISTFKTKNNLYDDYLSNQSGYQ